MQLSVVALTFLLVVILPSHLTHAGFQTDWDKPFLFECPLGQVLNKIYSVHSNRREDRRWKFSCADGPGDCVLNDCHWTDYVNNWDAPMNFMCPTDYVVAGLQSYHDNRKEDRLFKFKCCSHEGNHEKITCLNEVSRSPYE
ncbi:hemagglutinin/amebocyte aggregation factor [Elysia marginata]|uniref:Hemagglutinin/amebocyte aggregation factor n=1 Tax=Elysia marginata TaxID=1093978 RepID=A0AAV4IT86_9GAST|nr:hemagglutinin/amebocyte aggregation factor [Elysia marginata]